MFEDLIDTIKNAIKIHLQTLFSIFKSYRDF